MFKNLFNFGYKRNWKEAVCFYLAFLVLVILMGGVSGGLVSTGVGLIRGSMSFKEGYAVGSKVGYFLNIFFILTICGLLLTKKRLWSSFGCILLAC